MKIKAKRLSDTAKLPTYGSKKAACCDLYCDLRVDKCIDLNPANVDFKHMEYSGDYFDRVHIAPHETIKLMSEADVVFFCNGWHTSRGCQIEHDCALEYGIDTMYEEDLIF